MATRADFIIDQGTTFSTTVTISQDDGTLLDLTDPNGTDIYTARGRLAKNYSTGTQVDFTCTVNDNSPSQDTITMSLTATQTGLLKAGLYVYDLEIVSGSTVTRVLEGQIEVTPSLRHFNSSNGIGDESPSGIPAQYDSPFRP